MEKKGPFLIKELRSLEPGKQLWGKYLVSEKLQRKTKDGKTIINLKISDSSGDIDVVVWESCDVAGEINSGSVIGLLGDLGLYNNRLQITAKRIKVIDEDINIYLKGPAIDIEELEGEMDELVQSITDPYIAKLLHYIFTPEIKEAFIKAPAAKMVHHNYPGGLLEHTLKVAKICGQATDLYPLLNRDLLVAGAILHDIGKIKEYEIIVLPEYTVSGRMVGHIVLGNEMIANVIDKIRQDGDTFPPNLEVMIKHMILSHHGYLEYGSPVTPLFPEAFVLHMADNLDAKLFVYLNKIAEDEESEDLFTPYDSFFEQYFFKYRYEAGEE
ncbi:MAG TPA: HD domain-containing protein [Syntrophomonadaceae bacterium]|nr:HD domain-containing protein [Syntrophomonadaceae bacterium]